MKAYEIISIILSIFLFVGCDDKEKEDPIVQHPNPTATISFLPTSPTVNQAITLDGTGSTTSYGVAFVGNPANLTFAWQLTIPTGSAATLSSATSSQPTFTPDIAGSYEASLIVTDPSTGKASVQSAQTIAAADIPNPTAVISFIPTSPTVNQAITLDGTGSTTSYGVAFVGNPANLTFAWQLTGPTGSTATLSLATSSQPTFTPDIIGNYEASLIVTDPSTGKASVQSAQTIAAADIPNPTAVITAPTTGTVGTQVSLSGTSSTTSYGVAYTNTPSANLTFLWALTGPTGFTATLSSTTGATPTFIPDLGGAYTATLTVTDVATSKVSSQVQHVVTVPVPDPTAVITAPTTGTVGTQVSLSGTSSTTSYGVAYTNTPSANLTFLWALTGPTGFTATLSATNTDACTFTPDLEGPYTVSLTVTDVSTTNTNQIQQQITVTIPRLTVALTGTPATKSLMLTSGTAVFPITLSANSVEDITLTGLTVQSSNDAAVYQADIYGGTSSTLIATYYGTAYASSGVIAFTNLSVNIPTSGSYYLEVQVMFMYGVAGQSLTLSIDTTQDITAVGATSASTLHNTTSTVTDQIIGPAGAGATSDTITWEEWVLRDSLIRATMPNEVSGSCAAPNGATATISRFTLTPYSNASAVPYIAGIFVKVSGKAQTGTLSAYQNTTLLGQSAVYHDSRKRLMWQDVPNNFADGAETLHWIPFANGLSISSATVVEIKASVYTIGGSTTSWSLTVSLCLDYFIWYDNGDPLTNTNSIRANYLDTTPGAALSPTAALSFAGGTTSMADPGRATMVSAQVILVQASNSEAIVIWNRPVWKTQGSGAGYFTIWNAAPSSTTSIYEYFATVPAPTVYPRNWTVIRHNNGSVMIQTQVDLVVNPPSPTTDIIVVGADGTHAIDHNTSTIIDCRR